MAQAISNSLDRNGTGGMRAALDMGGYRINNLSDGVLDSDAATGGQAVANTVPLGAVLDYWGDFPPTNYLFCYGQEISRTEYADLFAVIGTSAGVGDGATTFNLPDYRAVASVGRANMGGDTKTLLSNFAATVLGSIFGSQSHTLTTSQIPAHTHSGTTSSGGSHGHNIKASGSSSDTGNYVERTGTWDGGYVPSESSGSHTHSFTTGSTGSGAAHNNVQPTIVSNKIMKVA